MSIDKFERYGVGDDATSKPNRCPPDKLSDDGNINIINKRFCSVGDPMLESDAVNKKYVRSNSITLFTIFPTSF